MAVTKSQLFTNLTASPPVMTTVSESHGRKRAKVCRITTTASLFYALCRVNSGDRILSVKLWNPTTANATDADFGLYSVTDGADDPAGTEIKDADILSATNNLASTANNGAEILGLGSGAVDEGDIGDACWSLAGDSVNTVAQYDVYMQINGTTAGRDITVIIEYLAGD